MRLVAAFIALNLLGCLPPPRPWLETGPAGPPGPAADDSGASLDGGASQPDTDVPDSGEAPVSLQCHSLAFEDNGHVVVTAPEMGVDSLFHDQSVTIELWAWFSDETRDGTWLLAGLDGTQTWRLGIELGELVLRAGIVTLSIPLPDNGWNHIAGVVDGERQQMSLYVNGAFSGRKDWLPPMVNTTLEPAMHFGAWHTEGGSWPSAIDEVRFSTSVMHEELDFEPSADRSVSPWMGVWRFDESLKNAVTGQESSGENFRFTEACP